MKTNKMHRVLQIVSILFIGMMGFASQAQSLNQEFITTLNGDLWKFNIINNISTQLTTSGYNYSPILSPDGQKLAFNSIPPESLVRQSQGEYVGDAIFNINIMDIATAESTLIADQVNARPEGILRSSPTWSPDSTRLLWAEFNGNTQTFQTYDLNTGVTSIFADNLTVMVGDADMVGFSQIEWSEGGIATMILDYTTAEVSRNLEIYNPDTGAVRAYNFPIELWGFKWVNYQGRELILLDGENRFELFDPATGASSALNSPPHLKSKFADNSFSLFQVVTNENPRTLEWYVDDGLSETPTGYTGWTMPTLSSDGFTLAWHDEDGVSIWQSDIGETKLADNPPYDNEDYLKPQGSSSVAWGVMEWFINETVTLSPLGTTTDGCFGSPPTRLTQELNPAMNAVVLPGDANNIRDEVGGSVIGKIPAGFGMLITGEAKCDANGIRYYPIEYDGITGWTAEGQGNDYWLEPFNG